MSAWRSPSPAFGCPSIGTFAGIGYGPRSDSSAYSKCGRAFGVERPETTTYGIPIRLPSQSPEPKSAWAVASRPIERIIVTESFATGSRSTATFHGLVAGNTWQPPIVGAGVVAAPADAATAPATSTSTRRWRPIAGVIGRL